MDAYKDVNSTRPSGLTEAVHLSIPVVEDAAVVAPPPENSCPQTHPALPLTSFPGF